MDYNVEEIERFGRRLEEQASNFEVATNHINYDWDNICNILMRYHDEAHMEYARQARNFGEGWMQARNIIKSEILNLASNMRGFYEATKENASSAADDLARMNNNFETEPPKRSRWE